MQGLTGVLRDYDIVLFDRPSLHKAHGDVRVINGAIGARRSSPLVEVLIRNALNNLAALEKREREAEGYIQYNVAVLTGAWMIFTSLFGLERPFCVKEEFKGAYHFMS